MKLNSPSPVALVRFGALMTAAALLSCVAKVDSVDYATARDAYRRFDFATALRGIRPEAEKGNAEAQEQLGEIYEKGTGVPQDYHEALKWYKLAAAPGNAKAEVALGRFYDDGLGMPKDPAEANRWLKRASDHGSGDGSYRLADNYYHGVGTKVDRYEAIRFGVLAVKQGELFGCFLTEGAYNPKEANFVGTNEYLKWLRFGAENGVASAQLLLGVEYHDGGLVPKSRAEELRWIEAAANQSGECAKSNVSVHIAQSLLGGVYETGEGKPQNYSSALKWYRLAADGGFPDAQFKLGVMLVTGKGVPQDYSEGAKYYRMAADQGDTRAQAALASSYFLGHGVPQDYVQAHMWANLASVGGNSKIQSLRNEAEEKMTAEQVTEAQRLAREWKPKANQ